jgi:hypothetical protein
LTTFLLWPVLLACLMVSSYWTNLAAVFGYISIVLTTCLTTAVLALFCSVVFRKTSVSLMTSYLVIIVLFCVPLAARFFAEGFFPDHEATPYVIHAGLTSPFAATFAIPLDVDISLNDANPSTLGNLPLLMNYGLFSVLANVGLLSTMIWLFNTRWRVSDSRQ